MKLVSVCAAFLLGVLHLPAVAAEIQLQSASSVMLPGGDIEMRLEFDAPPPSPKSYKIDQPPRVVMDLWGVENDMPQKKVDVLNGSVRDISFAQVDGRLRVVVGLFETAGFKTYTEDNSLYIVVSETLTETTAQTTSVLQQMKSAVRSDTELLPNATRVTGVDFKRVSDGVGQVVISLSDDQAGVDIVEEGHNVVVNLLGAGLSTALEQRIDVQDFATPVQFVDAMGSGENTTILVKPGSEPYNYLAYQAGNQLILDFKPVTDEENAARQAELFPYSGEALDLNFQDIELRSVLQIIAEVAELNLVVSDEVSGGITLRLKNVPWDQALDIVLKAKGLDKRILGNVLLVAPAAE
ncbi:MAG: AMIN domain-containing protein, partial [Pontibacterium sp.]